MTNLCLNSDLSLSVDFLIQKIKYFSFFSGTEGLGSILLLSPQQIGLN